MEIHRYVIVDANNVEENGDYDTLHEAKAVASKRQEPVAIIDCTYVFDDSELVWSNTGDDTWPPPGATDGATATCDNCGEDIEYDSGNEPPWTHVDTGLSNCDGEDFHAEPKR